jgi:DNA polymerase III alpha subunit (gram-positive type)
MTILFLDFETSGLNPYHDDIIEIAAKVMNSDMTFSTLVQPKSDECISQKITSITGITNKLLHEEGLKWQKAYQDFNDFLKGIIQNSPNNKLYIVSHNGETFDFIFLKRLFNELNDLNIKPIPLKNIVFIDSLLFAKKILKNRMSYRQETLCKTYNIITTGNHRALNDVIALEQLYISLCEILNKNLNKRRSVLDNPQMINDYIHFKR